MAAAPGDGSMSLMHPFFQKVSSKVNGRRPTPPKSEDVTSSTEDTHSPSADSKFYDDSAVDSPTSLSVSQLGDQSSQKAADDYEISKNEQDQIDTGPSSDLAPDLNMDRRKRRKLSSSNEAQARTQMREPDWLHQLVDAAGDGTEPAPEVAAPTGETLPASPKTKKHPSEPPVTPRRTPRKVILKTKPEQKLKSSRIRGAESPDIAASLTIPVAKGTPKKKVIKLSRNGKLLSSPTLLSPQSRSTGEIGEDKHEGLQKSQRVVLRYGTDEEGRSRIGIRIDQVLNNSGMSRSTNVPGNDAASKPTHPFFLGKLARNLQPSAGDGAGGSSNQDQISGSEDKPGPIKVVAWKDIIFKSHKPTFTKTQDAIGVPWPSRGIQHLGAAPRDIVPDYPLRLRDTTASKSKEQREDIKSDEDVIQNFSDSLQIKARPSTTNYRIPQRIVATGEQILAMLDTSKTSKPDDVTVPVAPHPAIARVRSLLPTTSTAFDQGRIDVGTAWTVKHAPQNANDVLQPAALQLRDWMKALTTSVTQKMHSSLGDKTIQASKKTLRKKKRRKISSELDGFIASSEDEADGIHGINVKNAVLISGPAGCGKTASVFAVAKELDFEVFEVHPGMRRNARDLFDKVGDMTQNHLVQGAGDGAAATTSTHTSDTDPVNQEISSGKQGTMNRFFSSKPQTGKQRKSPRKTSKVVENAKVPKTQRQSVILLEEVDILFDEDRGFWSGVVALISQSKRPIVFTCNDESSIPFDELSLHAILRYEPPSPKLASEYLIALAAQEGHILDRDCVRSLYRSKGNDLRAAIAELDFWCQLGVGSQKGGLDWMLDRSSTEGQSKGNYDSLRVFSRDTYASGTALALPSQVSRDYQQEELLNHAQDYLGIKVADWHDASDVLLAAQSSPDHIDLSQKRIHDLQHAVEMLDSRSVLDLFDGHLAAALSVRIASAFTFKRAFIQQTDVERAYFTTSESNYLTRDDLLDAFDPMTIEKPTFPPAFGRLAPSLDGPTSTIATEIAPYVRSIVAFDQRLEQLREAMTGDLQGKKVRKTRAARAALEGGSKANTRREKWFSERTDFTKVMQTAGDGWPIGTQSEPPSLTQSQESTVSSPETGPRASGEE